MLISYQIPDLEIRRSSKPLSLVLSADRLKPLQINARANQFVVNDKRVRGIYNINNEHKYIWDNTNVTIYWHVVEEANAVDPIYLDKINKFMEDNSLTQLTTRDIKQAVRLRHLADMRNMKEALTTLQKEEKIKEKPLTEVIQSAKEKINQTEIQVKEQYGNEAKLSPTKMSYILLDHLLEQDQIDRTQYVNLLARVDNKEFNFERLLLELKELHQVNITTPMDLDTEKFILSVAHQEAQQWAGCTQDLIESKGGLYQMLSKQIKPFLSYFVGIPANLLKSFKKNIEVHFNAPVALVIIKRRIYPRVIRTKHRYFVINDPIVNGIFELKDKCQIIWEKTGCYVYNLDDSITDLELMRELGKYQNVKSLLSTVKAAKKGKLKINSVMEYLFKNQIIDVKAWGNYYDEIKKGLKFNDLIKNLEDKKLIKVCRPLNLGVKGFIGEIGSQNAQEWAGLTQDLRNISKESKDLTKIPTKNFLSFGVIIGFGFVLAIVMSVVLSHSGSGSLIPGFGGGNNTKGFLGMFGGKMIDILGSHEYVQWLASHIPFLGN